MCKFGSLSPAGERYFGDSTMGCCFKRSFLAVLELITGGLVLDCRPARAGGRAVWGGRLGAEAVTTNGYLVPWRPGKDKKAARTL